MQKLSFKKASFLYPRSQFQKPSRKTSRYSICDYQSRDTRPNYIKKSISMSQIKSELEIYQWRFNNTEDIVHVYSVTIEKTLRNSIEISLDCQKKYLRIQDVIQRLILPEIFYIFRAMIKTYKALCNKFGKFKITEEMTEITKNGKFRLWINKDFTENSVQYPLNEEEDQMSCILSFFDGFNIKDPLFSYIRKQIKALDIKIENYTLFQRCFLKSDNIQQIDRLDTKRLELIYQEITMYNAEIKRPSVLSEKSTNISTLISESKTYVHYLTNNTSAILHFSDNSSSRYLKKSFKKNTKDININKVENQSITGPKKLSKSQQISRQCIPCQPYFSFFNNIVEQQSIQTSEKYLGYHKRSQKQLSLLGKFGRLCESKTVQQLIIEQFKQIY